MLGFQDWLRYFGDIMVVFRIILSFFLVYVGGFAVGLAVLLMLDRWYRRRSSASAGLL